MIRSKRPLFRLLHSGMALLGALSLVTQTTALAYAQVLPAGPGTAVSTAPNGVPLVNIATPSASGLSHNTYTQFDVGTPGLILNNSTVLGQSQLGGTVFGNPNLNGQPARVILNEVTSTRPSALNGTIEVYGSSAAVVIANPNGISCEGCGFINTPNVTLSTGTPVISNGMLTGLSVNGGTVTVGAGGLDGRQTDYVGIISRAAILNGAIHGNDLAIITGRNDFDYASGTSVAKSDDGSAKPVVSIDSSALGGMYAGRITLDSTEAGVGVNAPTNMVAGPGGMRITADGRLVINNGSASGAVAVRSKSSAVTVTGTLYAGTDLSIVAAEAIGLDQAITASGGQLLLNGRSVDLGSGTLIAGVAADGTALGAGSGAIDIIASAGVSTGAGSAMRAGGTLSIAAGSIDIGGQLSSDTGIDLAAATTLSISSGATLYGVATLAPGTIKLSSGGALDNAGAIKADTIALAVAGTLTNTGEIVAVGDLTADVGNLINSGAIGAGRDLTINSTGDISNHDLLAAKRDMVLNLDGTLANGDADKTATILAGNNLTIAGRSEAAATAVINTDAIIEANQGNLVITADTISNRTTGISIVTDYQTDTVNSSVEGECIYNWGGGDDTVCARVDTAITTQIWTDRLVGTVNAARLLAGADMTLTGNQIENTYGLIAANGDLTLTGTTLTNTAQDLIRAETTTVAVTDWGLFCAHYILFACNRHEITVMSQTSDDTTISATIQTVHATIQAGGTLSGSFTSLIDNITIRQNAEQIGLSSGGGVAGPGAPSLDLAALLKGGSLTQRSPNPNARYLIDSRPEFVDLSAFFNSDYFFSRMPGYNPELMMRRLGDAYVETRLIQDQIFALTGRRLLEGFGADLDQIQALYDNALDAATTLNLTVGIALTAEQIAALTQDIIWQELMIVDGQTVLVPRVYLAGPSRTGTGGGGQLLGNDIILASAELTNSGAIASTGQTQIAVTGDLVNLGGAISGDSVALDVGGTLANLSGTIAGDSIDIAAGNLVNQTLVSRDPTDTGFSDRLQQDATISGTGAVNIAVDNDLTMIGGSIAAGDDLAISAGGNIDIAAVQTEQSSSVNFEGGNSERYSLEHQQASLAAGGNLTLEAGQDLSLTGADLATGESASLTATGDVSIGAVTDIDTANDSYSASGSGLFAASASGASAASDQTTIGSSIDAFDNLSITAGGDTNITASTLAAGDDLAITAGGDLSITGQLETDQFSQSSSASGFLMSDRASESATDQTYNGSLLIGGGNVTLKAGGDAAINGSTVVAGNDLDVAATNVTLGAGQAQDSYDAASASSGLFAEGGNGGFAIGYRNTSDEASQSSLTNTTSALSAGNNLTITAAEDITSEGGYLGAGNDLTLDAGNDITLSAVTDNFATREHHEKTEIGLSVGVQENVSGKVETLIALPDSLQAGQGSGLNKAVTAASAALEAIDAVKALQEGNLVSASITLGLSTEQSSASQSVNIADGGTLAAGGDITLKAGNDISTEGTQILAGEDITLAAGNDITLGAAQNSASASNDASSASVGVSLNAGIGVPGLSGPKITPSISVGFNIAGQTSEGSEQSLSHTNTNVMAGGDISITSGNDTTLAGARVEGETVTADIGGDLSIESLQDTASGSNSSAGGSVGITVNPVNGAVGGSVAVNGGTGNSDSAWVNEQSGIYAENQIDITVGGNTDLIGGAIVSESGDLTLDTGILTFSDLKDHDTASNTQGGINLSAGLDQPGTPSWSVDGTYEGHDKEQETRATIGEGEITIRDDAAQQALEDTGVTENVAGLNRDPDLAQEITRDEESYVGVYASDTSVAAAIAAIDVVGKTLAELFEEVGDDLIVSGQLTPEGQSKLKLIGEGLEDGSVRIADILHCINGGQAFNLWNLIVTPAYASGGCTIFDANGTKVTELTPQEHEACIKELARIMAAGLSNVPLNGEPPFWVGALAGQLRGLTPADLEMFFDKAGEYAGAIRGVALKWYMGDEAYAQFEQEVLRPLSLYGDLGTEAANIAVREWIANANLSPQGANDVLLLATVGVGVVGIVVKGGGAIVPDGVSFGRNSNQDHHVWRHVEDELGMNRQDVQRAVVADLPPITNLSNGLNVRYVTVGGVRLQYNAFKLPDGTVNIGRIHEAN